MTEPARRATIIADRGEPEPTTIHAPTIKRPATYQDVIDAPAGMVAELIRGALHLQPRPRPRHSHAMVSLAGDIGQPFSFDQNGPGGWIILVEPGLYLGDEVLVPDLAGWRREPLAVFPEEVGVTTPPNWVCEILSPSTRTDDLTDKRDIDGERVVAHLWFVDPVARTLEAFALDGGSWRLIAALHDDAEARVAPFDAAAFPLASLWPPG